MRFYAFQKGKLHACDARQRHGAEVCLFGCDNEKSWRTIEKSHPGKGGEQAMFSSAIGTRPANHPPVRLLLRGHPVANQTLFNSVM